MSHLPSDSSNCCDRLYVGGFATNISTEQIKKMINEASQPFKISIEVVENGLRKHRGFAFIQCNSSNDASVLLPQLSRVFSKVNFARREHSPPNTIMSNISNVFIRGLSKELNDSELFEAFGGVLEGVVQCHVADGYGFVLFDSRKNAEKKIKEMNGAVLKGQQISVTWARPDVHGRKRKRPADESIASLIDFSPSSSLLKRCSSSSSSSYPSSSSSSNTQQQQILHLSPGQPSYTPNPFQFLNIPIQSVPQIINPSLFLPPSFNIGQNPNFQLSQPINPQHSNPIFNFPYLNLLL